MKKVLLFLVATLMFLSVNESYSQSCCPSGLYTQVTLTGIVNPASGCLFNITYCYYNAPTGSRKVFICNIEVPFTQPFPCNLDNFYLNSIFWELVTNTIILDLNDENPFIPCGEGGGGQSNLIVEFTKAKCIKREVDYFTQVYRIVACNEQPGNCITEYSVCIDSYGMPIKTYLAGPTATGLGNCGNYPPDINHFGPDCYQNCE